MKKNKKPYIKKLITWALTIIVIALMVHYLNNNRDIFTNLRKINALDIIAIALLQPINILFSAIINKLIIDSIDQQIPISDALLLQFTNNFLNRFISEGGAVYRGIYLKAQFDFPISKFLASLGGVYIIGLSTNALLGIILSGIIYIRDGVYNIYLLGVFAAILIGAFLLIFIHPQFKSENWFLRKLNQVSLGWLNIKRNKPLIIKIFVLSLLGLANSSLIVFIVYRSLGTDVQFLNTIFYSTISSMVNVINLTPGGLGINEAILMFSSDVIGISSEMILLGALLLRAISMISTLTIGAMSYFILNARLQKSNTSKNAPNKEQPETRS